ncbi:MAG: UDP-forming cellulose synthase catalytic subunit [Chromatocurvus sp.]
MPASRTERQGVLWPLALVALLLLAALLCLPLDAAGQGLAAVLFIGVMAVASAGRLREQRDFLRVLALLLGAALNLRYLWWRGTHTLTAADMLTWAAVLYLFAAELYAVSTHFIGSVVNVFPAQRPLLGFNDIRGVELPSVDVLVPSYNESADLLETTLRAARMLDYPADRLRVYLLDDGATKARLQHSDPDIVAAAHARRDTLQALCLDIDVTYLAREKNEHAKAGNLNFGLAHSDSELVLVLDADHVPATDFLEHTVPWMVKNPRNFLVQTPHFMLNADPVERNHLGGFASMPSEGDMFYGKIQRGLDFWSSSFFCGSAALLRRRALDEVGGFSGDTITEDAETALALHAKGYQSVYVDRPMVSGLVPDSVSEFVTQRSRWAQGMVQILLLKRPQTNPGLTWHQRLGYLNAMLFWLFPFSRLAFLIMPVLYLIFGMQVYPASLAQILAFAIPHLVATYMVSNLLFGRRRWPLVAELYETLLSIFIGRAVLTVLRNPRSPTFRVTEKSGQSRTDSVSTLAWPFYLLLIATAAAAWMGGMKLWESPQSSGLTAVVLFWNLFNLILLLGVMRILVEKRQLRHEPRLPTDEPVSLLCADGRVLPARLRDVSASGAGLVLQGDAVSAQDIRGPLQLRVSAGRGSHTQDLSVAAVMNAATLPRLALQFTPRDSAEMNRVVAFTMANSERWMRFQRRRSRPMGYLAAFGRVVSVDIRPLASHAGSVINRLYTRMEKLWTTA